MNIIILLLILIIILIIIYYFIYNKNINIHENFYTALSDNAIKYRNDANELISKYNETLLDIQGYKKQAQDTWNNFVNNGRTRTLYNNYLTANSNLSNSTIRLSNILADKNDTIGKAINAENLAAIENAELEAKAASDAVSKVISDTKAESDAKAAETIKAGQTEREKAINLAKEKADEAKIAAEKAYAAKTTADAAKIEADKAENDAKIAAKVAADALAYANSDSASDGIPEFNISTGISSLTGTPKTSEPFAFNKNELFFVKI